MNGWHKTIYDLCRPGSSSNPCGDRHTSQPGFSVKSKARTT